MKLLLAILLSAAPVLAQGTATIFGSVSDASGGVVRNVTVKATHAATGAVREAVTGESGGYVLTQLPVGGWNITAEAPGFKKFVQPQVLLQVDDNRQLNISLQLGAVSESVTVEAEAVQV